MPEGTHSGRIQRQSAPDRYAGSHTNQKSAPDAWIAAASNATTVAELEQVARQAQSDDAWLERDAAWCRAKRDALLVNDEAAMALLRRDLGARPLGEVAS